MPSSRSSRPRPPTSPPFEAWFTAYPDSDHPAAVCGFVARAIRPVWLRYGDQDHARSFEDLLQDVLVQMCRTFSFRNLEVWRPPAVAYARLTAKHRLWAINEPQRDAGDEIDPQALTLDLREREKCQAALRRMPPGRPRTVIALQLRGWSNERIAEYLGENVDTVNSTWASRGRKQLREAYEDHGDGEIRRTES